MSLKTHRALAAGTILILSGAAQAAFQGRDAAGAPSSTCTPTGASKCTYFYDTTLDITILNDWNIGQSYWDASATPISAQWLAAQAGLAASGLSGWVLPTGDGTAPAGAQNQYLSIFNSVGGSSSLGLFAQFDGVHFPPSSYYWSASPYAPSPATQAWMFESTGGFQTNFPQGIDFLYAVAVRPGDVALAVPEPQTYALLLVGLAVLTAAVRRRSGTPFGQVWGCSQGSNT